MTSENNRLNFPNMVDRQLKHPTNEPGLVGSNIEYFETTVMKSRQSQEHHKPKRPTHIDNAINSIVMSVHRNLEETIKRRANQPTPTIEKPNIEINTQYEPNVTKLAAIKNVSYFTPENNANNKVMRVNFTPRPPAKLSPPLIARDEKNSSTESDGDDEPQKPQHDFPQKMPASKKMQNKCKTKITINPLMKTIPQIEAGIVRNYQQRLYHCPSKAHLNNGFEAQKRLRAALHQKQMLEEILQEHEKIQQDRRSISTEIQEMKKYLAEIRSKLDSSLRKLDSKKLVVEKLPRENKKLIAIPSNLITPPSTPPIGKVVSNSVAQK